MGQLALSGILSGLTFAKKTFLLLLWRESWWALFSATCPGEQDMTPAWWLHSGFNSSSIWKCSCEDLSCPLSGATWGPLLMRPGGLRQEQWTANFWVVSGCCCSCCWYWWIGVSIVTVFWALWHQLLKVPGCQSTGQCIYGKIEARNTCRFLAPFTGSSF